MGVHANTQREKKKEDLEDTWGNGLKDIDTQADRQTYIYSHTNIYIYIGSTQRTTFSLSQER